MDGARAPDKAALLGRLSEALRFPDYFGGNWDALQDCLTDLDSWLREPGYVLVLLDARSICRDKREDFAALRGVLESAAEFWRRQKPPRPFKVLLKA